MVWTARTCATLVAAWVAVLGLGLASASVAAAASSSHGCPHGDVCVYPHASWNDNHPSLRFFHYGPHNLHDQFGIHRVFNNQWSDADVWLCKGYNGYGGFTEGFNSPQWDDVNLGPVNSIQLTPNSYNALYEGCLGGAREKHP